MLRHVTILILLLSQAFAAPAEEPPPGPNIGDVFEIRTKSEWTLRSTMSSGASRSQSSLTERVIAVSEAGVELEFDLPAEATAEDRAPVWEYPVRVLRPPQGTLQLLNGAELEARVTRWLQAAELAREMCGRWYFTWNAFQIACDPQAVLQTLTALDLAAIELRDGSPYQEIGALGGVLRRESGGADGPVFVVEMEVDPEAVRRQFAELEAVTTEIIGDSPEQRAYLEGQAITRLSGTVRTRFQTDATGRVTRRKRVMDLSIERARGESETQTFTETTERRLVPRRDP